MTSGSQKGTSGRLTFGPWLAVLVVGAAVAFVNSTSGIIEGAGDHWIEPVLWETSSAIVIVAMAPLIGSALRRWPLRTETLPASALIHFGLTVPFSLVHVAAIFVMRETAYWAVGARYGFFDDGVAITLLYEWRKDVLVYAAIASTYWIFQYIAERREAAAKSAGDERIEIRDGGAAVFLVPGDILFVEAAGNYITFNTATRNYLVRGTLASWEARLAQRGFVRVHRGKLVNRSRIASIKPTPAGDIEITLDNGAMLAGSRRYRAQLESPTPTGAP
ncbi:MAG: LytR/AlgR family response regulator transcription factor [Vitreimonas sp.]